ncbi:MAG TPA: glycosyltransferase family 2 protein [Dongiaceae bacterium]|nr:glycosyltransferase family 2 protein [Dongiaceae bacterium]
MRTISIVVPAYNESECVDELAARLRAVFEGLAPAYDFEAIIVENGSADDTYEKLLAIRGRDPRFKIVRLSRNFGAEGGVTAGLRHASGDAAVIMCADLQDPPEVIPRFIERWEQGYQNVYGVVTRRAGEGLVRRAATGVFYWLIDKLSDRPVPRNVSDFRLVDRRAYEALNRMHERNRMMRTMWGWIGFTSAPVEHVRPRRHGGKSTYAFARNVRFALNGILASSVAPLKLIPLFGITLAGMSFVTVVGLAIVWVRFGVPFAGYGTIVALILLMFGLVFLFLGIISEYVGMIFEEVRARPSFIVAAEHGFDDDRARP